MPMIDSEILLLDPEVQKELKEFNQLWIGPEDAYQDGFFADNYEEVEDEELRDLEDWRFAEMLTRQKSHLHSEILGGVNKDEAGSDLNMYRDITSIHNMTVLTGVQKDNWKIKTKPPKVAKQQEEEKAKTGKFTYTHREKMETSFVQIGFAKNVWYYRDRMNGVRGPCNMPILRHAWANGVIDGSTLVWGQGLDRFLPIQNVRTLLPMIRTNEVRFVTWLKKKFVFQPHMKKLHKNPVTAERRKYQSNPWGIWD